MLRPRVIPCLLLKNSGFVKTTNFKNPIYLGDPINILRIFNEKEVDEIIILDINATKENRKPNFHLIEQIASEAFMPVCYGGGITSIEDIKTLLSLGIEKVSINSSAINNINLIKKSSEMFGNQCIIGSIDIKKNFLNKPIVYSHCSQKTKITNILDWCKILVENGAGEILINSVDNDGSMNGYDIDSIHSITKAVNVPVIACGGAGNLSHIKEVIHQGKASAAGVGSFFVFHGKHKGILISYINQQEMKNL